MRGGFAQKGYPRATGPLRASHIASAIFAAVAVFALTWNAVSPFERGWWLAAYLFLVGSASQLLLAAGQFALAKHRGTDPPAHALSWAQLGLWNLGTATVAVADMARVLTGVAFGSGLLITSIALFLFSARFTDGTRSRGSRSLEWGYLALLVFLAGSVMVGTVLAAHSQ